MGYAPGIEEFVDRCNEAMPPDFYTYPVQRQRELYLGLTEVFRYDLPAAVRIDDAVVLRGGRALPVRVYTPSSRAGAGVVFYIRGGGFVVGSLETHNTVVAELADRTGLACVAVNFRMAPENPFPAALEDCHDALRGVLADPAAVGLMLRDRGGPRPAGQALISPVLDFTRWRSGGEDAPLLTGGEMEYYTACYCPRPEQAAHPYVSPLVSGEFHDLPPAYIMGAEMDSLRVDGERYAAELARHGIPVEHVVEPGLVHAAVRARLRELRPRAVLAGCESGVELADLLAPRVVPEVANVPGLAGARRHKAEMAAAVATAGLPVIPQICSADAAEIAAWIDRTGLAGCDLVVKPPKSASTDGVTKVPGGAGWRRVFDSLICRPNRLGIVNDRLLVQQFAAGVEYVVDTFSHAGVHTLTDVCRYNKVDNGPYMAVYETMEWLRPDDPVIDTLLPYAYGVLDAVGLRYGAAHPRFCRVATGDSQIDRTVRYFTGAGDLPPRYRLLSHTLVVFHIARASGVLRNAEVLDAVESLTSHHFSVRHPRNGAYLPMTRDLFASLDFGFAVLTHQRPEQLRADYETLRRLEGNLLLDAAA